MWPRKATAAPAVNGLAFSHVGLPSKINCLSQHNGDLYIGCEDGLYRLRSDGAYEVVSKGRVQAMRAVNGTLYYGHGEFHRLSPAARLFPGDNWP